MTLGARHARRVDLQLEALVLVDVVQHVVQDLSSGFTVRSMTKHVLDFESVTQYKQ